MPGFLAAARAQLRAFARERTHRLVLGLWLAGSLLVALALRGGTLHDLPVAVLDLDGTGPSRTVARFLEATPELRLAEPPATLEEARAALARGDLAAAVVLPDGFAGALKRGRTAEVVVAIDMGNLLAGRAAQKAVSRVLATVAAGSQVTLLEKLGTPPAAAVARALPIAVTESLSRNPGSSFAPYLAPAYAWFLVNVLAVLLAWATLWPLPSPTGAGRAGRLAAAVAVAFAGGLVTAYGVLPLAGVPTAGPPHVVALALAALLVADALMVHAFAAAFRGTLLGFQGTVLLAMLSLMLSGLTFPADGLPAPLRLVAATLPFTPFSAAMRAFQTEPAALADLARPLAHLAGQALGWATAATAATAAPALLARRRRPA